jgi:NhaA family Na+:H+ antiporter
MHLATLRHARLTLPITERMHQNFTRLHVGLTIGAALEELRRNPPRSRIQYFYVVDDDNRLQGVVPTRQLLLGNPLAPLKDIMISKVVTIPANATVLEACEFFIQHRLLAFPVVDDNGRLLGLVDIELYNEELSRLEESTAASRLVAPVRRFLQVEAAGGIILLAVTVVAMLLANSPLAEPVQHFWETHVSIRVGTFALDESLLHWINDGLMTLFFFVVGLEIKREMVMGELAEPRKALLPVVAALGGMAMPALVYSLVLMGGQGWQGWPVPTATDIAFVVGVLILLGPRVPGGLKIFLLTLAIADDIGAVVLIAVVFSKPIDVTALALGIGGLGLVAMLRWFGVRSFGVYILVGIATWLSFLHSGIHPTVAGVFLGLLTPARLGLVRRVRVDMARELTARIAGEGNQQPAAQGITSPLEQLETALHPWVAFVIMPIFALANAGVTIQGTNLANPVTLGVALGLLVGKPLGIVLFSFLSSRLGLTRLPAGVNWGILVGAGCLGGIGFTMSLFIAGLAFEEAMRDQAKIGILLGSTTSGFLGSALLLIYLPSREGTPQDI